MTQARTLGRVSITDRHPVSGASEIIAALVPPPQFHGASFDSYRPDPDFPGQSAAVETLRTFANQWAPKKSAGLFSRRKREPAVKPGVYLDGGFGVGKTHLLASLWHAAPGPRKYFGTFIQFTSLVGALGYQGTVQALTGATLICIDEFELDDPGDTMVMTRLLGELFKTGTRVAATSNTPPNALGEGRFAAQDFLREISAMSDHFEMLRIDGTDYRRRSATGEAIVTADNDYESALSAGLPDTATVSDDNFEVLLDHLATVHPSRYMALVEDIARIGIRDVREITDQTQALRLVAFIDRVYDAQVPIIATGTPLDHVFSEEMLGGGYRKKYLRAVSRMIALTNSVTA